MPYRVSRTFSGFGLPRSFESVRDAYPTVDFSCIHRLKPFAKSLFKKDFCTLT